MGADRFESHGSQSYDAIPARSETNLQHNLDVRQCITPDVAVLQCCLSDLLLFSLDETVRSSN